MDMAAPVIGTRRRRAAASASSTRSMESITNDFFIDFKIDAAVAIFHGVETTRRSQKGDQR